MSAIIAIGLCIYLAAAQADTYLRGQDLTFNFTVRGTHGEVKPDVRDARNKDKRVLLMSGQCSPQAMNRTCSSNQSPCIVNKRSKDVQNITWQFTVTLCNVQIADSGVYEMCPVNGFGSCLNILSVNVTALVSSNDCPLRVDPKVQHVLPGASCKFEASTTPGNELRWYYGENSSGNVIFGAGLLNPMMNSDNRFTVISNRPGHADLVIKDVFDTDTANYAYFCRDEMLLAQCPGQAVHLITTSHVIDIDAGDDWILVFNVKAADNVPPIPDMRDVNNINRVLISGGECSMSDPSRCSLDKSPVTPDNTSWQFRFTVRKVQATDSGTYAICDSNACLNKLLVVLNVTGVHSSHTGEIESSTSTDDSLNAVDVRRRTARSFLDLHAVDTTLAVDATSTANVFSDFIDIVRSQPWTSALLFLAGMLTTAIPAMLCYCSRRCTRKTVDRSDDTDSYERGSPDHSIHTYSSLWGLTTPARDPTS